MMVMAVLGDFYSSSRIIIIIRIIRKGKFILADTNYEGLGNEHEFNHITTSIQIIHLNTHTIIPTSNHEPQHLLQTHSQRITPKTTAGPQINPTRPRPRPHLSPTRRKKTPTRHQKSRPIRSNQYGKDISQTISHAT